VTVALSAGPDTPTLYCSFCGKSQHEVRKLIAGPTVFICDECVELCGEIVESESAASIETKRWAVSEAVKLCATSDHYRAASLTYAAAEIYAFVSHKASVGRSPEGEDPAEGLHAQHEDAVPPTAADAQPLAPIENPHD
jgi:hypothetical protein